MINWNKKFEYPKSMRSLINDQRHYDIGQDKLPSVTTILSATQPEEKRKALEEWKQRVGNQEADKIKNEAATRGTALHSIVEGYLMNEPHVDLTPTGDTAHRMAHKLIKEGIDGKLTEVWGTEATMYYPGLYAGATDIVGVYEGIDSICDLKQSNKPKQSSWITDYYLQLAAYIMSHNYVYKTNIKQGVILMITPQLIFQQFIINEEQLKHYCNEWLKRIDQYYKEKKLIEMIDV